MEISIRRVGTYFEIELREGQMVINTGTLDATELAQYKDVFASAVDDINDELKRIKFRDVEQLPDPINKHKE